MSGETKRRRSSAHEQTPQRVQQAAQSMNSGFYPDGLQRGFDPRNTGGFRMDVNQSGIRNGNQVPMGNTGAYYSSSMTGSQRGFAPAVYPQNSAKKKKPRYGIIALISAAVLCAAAAICYFGIYAPREEENTARDAIRQQNERIESELSTYDNTFAPGIYVNDVSIGGLTGDEAMRKVQESLNPRNTWHVTLKYGEEKVYNLVNAENLKMIVDAETVQNALIQAWEPGHNVDGTKSNEQRLDEIRQCQAQPRNYQFSQPDETVMSEQLELILNQIATDFYQAPQNAAMLYFDPNLEYPFVFQNEVYGLSLDTAALKQQLLQMAISCQSGEIEIQPIKVEPTVKTDDLQKHYALRSTATTPIDKHSTDNRNNNIRRAFEFINGYELKAGKTFDFNQVVGKRTLANGFYTAEEYVYGEHQEGVGGGVCQASTTVYQAAVCAGLKITARKPHSDSVSYTDYGKDATVYWFETDKKPRTDLKFSNNTEGTIYIVARVEQDPSNKKRLRCLVSMYGEDLGEGVRYEIASEIVDVLPPPLEPEYVDSDEKVRKAKDGYRVQSYRLKYEGGVLTERKELYLDVYKPQAERVKRE